MKNRNRNIKRWYRAAYPTDECGRDIRTDATFGGAYDCLKSGGDIYDYIGVGDSIVRERVFDALETICGVPYEESYDMWMNN